MIIIWSPISERVGTIEVENSLVRVSASSSHNVYHIGAGKYYSNSFYSSDNVSQILPNWLLLLSLRIKHVLSGRLTVIMQSFSSLCFIIILLIKHKPSKIVFLTCLFPVPLLILYIVVKFFAPSFDFKCFAFIQGTPVFSMSQISRSKLNWRFFESIVRSFLYRYVYSQCDGLVASSRTLANILYSRKSHSRETIHVIPNGILRESNSSPAYELDNPRKCINFIFVGRITHQKNVKGLINSFLKCTIGLGYDSKLHIVGDGDMFPRLYSEFCGNCKIIFYGFLEDPWALTLENMVVIIPSFWEEPGHVPLEAINKGLITLTSSSCTCVDFFPDELVNRCTFDPYDLDFLFSNLCHINNLVYLLAKHKLLSSSIQPFTTTSFDNSVRGLFL